MQSLGKNTVSSAECLGNPCSVCPRLHLPSRGGLNIGDKYPCFGENNAVTDVFCIVGQQNCFNVARKATCITFIKLFGQTSDLEEDVKYTFDVRDQPDPSLCFNALITNTNPSRAQLGQGLDKFSRQTMRRKALAKIGRHGVVLQREQ